MSNLTDTPNETLAMLAKSGDIKARNQLWEQTHRLIIKLMLRYQYLVSRHGHDADDLMQAAYLAFLYAVDHYNPQKKFLFNSYLVRSVQHAIYDMLGWRVYVQKQQPPISLQISVPGLDGEQELQDSIPDPTAELDFESADTRALQIAVRNAVSQLVEQQQTVLYYRYTGKLTYEQIAKEMGITREASRKIEAQALRTLRKPEFARTLIHHIAPECSRPIYH